MKLPRYSSTSLPQERNISPQEAGAATMAWGQVAQQAASAASEFLVKMAEAEDRSKARELKAKQSIEVTELLNDERWQQDEVDGKPTEQVMMGELEKIRKRYESAGSQLTFRDAREEAQAFSLTNLEEARISVEDAGNKVRIRRTKARDKQTILELRRAGKWDEADNVLRAGYEDGIYILDELNAGLEENRKLKRTTPYIDILATDDESQMYAGALNALDDKSLDADERVSLYRTLSGAGDAVVARAMRQREEQWSQNSVDMWLNFDSLSPQDIAELDISPEMKNTAIRMKRSERMGAGSGGGSMPGVVSNLEASILRMGSDPSLTLAEVSADIADAAEAGSITPADGISLQQKAMSFDADRFKGANFTDLVRQGEMEITRGYDTKDLFDVFGDKGREIAILASDFRREIMQAKMREGAAFNAQKFYDDNIGRYREKANIIKPLTITDSFIRTRLAGKEGAELQEEKHKLVREIDQQSISTEEKTRLNGIVMGYRK